MREADVDRVVAVNAKSVNLTTRHFVPTKIARRSGPILNIAWSTGRSPPSKLN